ncbi:MAG TPA: BON domain-containing protein [Kofleriaceae bacterium]|nr:BON domain-containing protein [Kofleriaceae bacterium]
MANYQNNGGRNVAVPDENRQSWRPQDQDASSHRYRGGNEDDHDYRGWRERNFDDRMERDPRRWEGSRGSELGSWEDHGMGSTEYYGQGQSGYSAGRYGDDRSQHLQMQNRNDMRPSPGGFEERNYDLGTDDRFTGRGSSGWTDRNERSFGRYDRDRFIGQDSYSRDQRGYDQRNYEPRGGRGQAGGGYDRGFSQNGYGGQGYDARSVDRGHNTQHMGYQSSAARGETDWSPSQRHQDADSMRGMQGRNDSQQHMQRGAGPHRGKGPMGYQRSDERIREMVCEALADDDMIDASQIHVTVKDGEVTLSGVVESRRIKREAEDCVSNVSGVRDVQIQLRVRDDARGQAQSSQAQQGTSTSSASGSNASTSAGTQNASSHVGNGLGNGLSNGKAENESTRDDKKHRA